MRPLHGIALKLGSVLVFIVMSSLITSNPPKARIAAPKSATPVLVATPVT